MTFQPGQSGNPGGRAKGLSGLIRTRTQDGQSLVEFVIGLFENTDETSKIRLEAATWLADRGYGRPAQSVIVSGDDEAPAVKVEHKGVALADVLDFAERVRSASGSDKP